MYKRVKKFICFLIVFIVSVSTTIFDEYAAQEKIKVGLPLTKGLGETDGKGNYKGYIYEYLNEIAKYTGWEYEFLPIGEEQFDESFRMLAEGELDIIGGMLKNEQTEKIFDFPEYSSGVSYATLSVMQNDAKYSENDYQSFNDMKVGVVKTATRRIKRLQLFASTNGITLHLIEYNTEKELLHALRAEEIDAILSGDVILENDLRILARFSADPYYFATTKNNVDILNGLNMAISKIKEVDINYDTQLYSKYFPEYVLSPFVLSEKEKEYVNNMKPLAVAVGYGGIPMDYFNEEGQYCGIMADIFARISQMTNIQFKFVEVKSLKEAISMLDKEEIDIVTGIYDDSYFQIPKNITLFTSFLSLPMILVKQSGLTAERIASGTMALPKGYELIEGLRKGTIKYYDSIKECMIAVQKGEVDYCYGNAYAVEYYQHNYNWNKVSLLVQPESERTLSFGIRKPVDATLLGIINKAINHISSDEKQQIIFNNTSSVPYEVTVLAFIRAHAIGTVLTVSFISALLMIIITLFSYKKRKLEEKSAQRYKIVSELTDEVLFEYDIKRDQLMISEKYASSFGMKHITKDFLKSLKEGNLHFSYEDVQKCGFYEYFKEAQNTFEIQWKFAGNTKKWFQIAFIMLKDKYGNNEICLGKIKDIDEEYSERNKLKEMAQKDSLTGLYNKGTAQELCKDYLKHEGKDRIHAYFIIDVDNFKGINDTFGHICGDEILKKVSELICNPFREDDVIGRIGGDEFTVFVKNIPSELVIQKKAEEIQKAFSKIRNIKEYPISVSCSIGISIYPKDAKTFEELYQKADIALYKVKEKGKNGYCLYDESMSFSNWKSCSISKIESEDKMIL